MSSNSKVKVAVIQGSPIFLDREHTLESVAELTAEAALNGARLVLFPETFVSAYPDWVWSLPPAQKDQINALYTELLESSVSIPDDATKQLGEIAHESGVYLAIGVNERNTESSNASLYNTLLYFDPTGKLLGKHRKLIPTGGERLMWAPGDGDTLVSFETELGRVGGLICWENFMPLPRVAMYQAGVQIYLAPTWDSSPSWLTAMKHIAREGGMFVLSCCQAIKVSDVPDRYEFKNLYAEGREWVNQGNSCIVNPKGEIIAGPLEAEQGMLYADLDLAEIPAQKWMLDVAGHYSRPDVFEFSVKRPGRS
ncbi:MAG: carbon-nitrogen hydrolase family protein [bacterium]